MREQPIEEADDSLSEGEVESANPLEELEAALGQARDQLLRRTAEMDNMRRRFEQERELLIFDSNKRLISDLLPTLDDMERTLAHAGSERNAVVQGMELVHKNFVKVLERYGLTAMDTVGKPFDVHAHDALMEEPHSDVEAGTITQEIQKGYWLNDSVLRHAKVIVAREPD